MTGAERVGLGTAGSLPGAAATPGRDAPRRCRRCLADRTTSPVSSPGPSLHIQPSRELRRSSEYPLCLRLIYQTTCANSDGDMRTHDFPTAGARLVPVLVFSQLYRPAGPAKRALHRTARRSRGARVHWHGATTGWMSCQLVTLGVECPPRQGHVWSRRQKTRSAACAHHRVAAHGRRACPQRPVHNNGEGAQMEVSQGRRALRWRCAAVRSSRGSSWYCPAAALAPSSRGRSATRPTTPAAPAQPMRPRVASVATLL